MPQVTTPHFSDLQAENSSLKDTVNKQNIMLSNLNEMLVKGRKAMFGKSSEQLSNIEGSEQLTLFNEAEQEYSAASPEPTAETITVNSHSRKKRLSREELPDSVEHKKVVIDLDDKSCPEHRKIAPRHMHLLHTRPALAAVIATALHSHCKVKGPAKCRHKKGDKHRDKSLCPFHDSTVVKVCTTGFLSHHNFVRFFKQSRNKS